MRNGETEVVEVVAFILIVLMVTLLGELLVKPLDFGSLSIIYLVDDE